MAASVDWSRSVRNWGVVADTEVSLPLFWSSSAATGGLYRFIPAPDDVLERFAEILESRPNCYRIWAGHKSTSHAVELLGALPKNGSSSLETAPCGIKEDSNHRHQVDRGVVLLAQIDAVPAFLDGLSPVLHCSETDAAIRKQPFVNRAPCLSGSMTAGSTRMRYPR